MLIHSGKHFVGIERIILVEQHASVLHIIDVGTDTVHAVSWSYGDSVVHLRLAEHTVNEVDRLVAAVAKHYLRHPHTLYLGDFLLELKLQRVRITVVRRVERILVGIEIDSRLALELVASARVRSQVPYVVSN